MSAHQLLLIQPAKPLVERFGASFFREIPEKPGVYLFCGATEGVLYVGKAKNLRKRLNSYRTAHPERLSRKVLRLLRRVERILWDECMDEEGAILRENQLLRTLRPKFNRMNVFPQRRPFLGWSGGGGPEFSLGVCWQAQAFENVYGVFKGPTRACYESLLRLLWGAVHRPASMVSYPSELLGSRTPCRFTFGKDAMDVLSTDFMRLLDAFLRGTAGDLVQWLAVRQPSKVSIFQRNLARADLDLLLEFYVRGPWRNSELREELALPGETIASTDMDDMLVRFQSAVTRGRSAD